MRLIDAGALLERWCSEVCKTKPNCAEDCMMYDYLTIDSLSPTIEPEKHWIPCSERLPEEEGWYLVTIQNDKTRKRRTENDLFAIGIAEAHKHTPYKFCKDGHRQTVIAWMPIPEPYKAESEEI